MKLKTAKRVMYALCGAMVALIILCVAAKGTMVSLVFACMFLVAAVIGIVVGGLFLKCPHCGYHFLHGQRFCPNCRKELNW